MATSSLVNYLDDWCNILILYRRMQPQYPEGWLSTDELAAKLDLSRSAIRERIKRIKGNTALMQHTPHFDPAPGEVTDWATYKQLAEETGLSPSGVATRVTQMKRDLKLKALLEGQGSKEIRENFSRELYLLLLMTIPADMLPDDLRPISTPTKGHKQVTYDTKPETEPVELDTTNLAEMLKFTFREENVALCLETIQEALELHGFRISRNKLSAFLDDFDRITFNSEEKTYRWA